MKKYISTILTAAAVMIGVQMFSSQANAQGRSCDTRGNGRNSRYSQSYDRGYENVRYNRSYETRSYDNRVTYDPYYSGSSNVYYDPYYNGYNNYGTTAYDRHRKAVNVVVGTGVGAAIGAMVGGTRGAAIGAAAGAIGGAIVTAKQNPRNYPRY